MIPNNSTSRSWFARFTVAGLSLLLVAPALAQQTTAPAAPPPEEEAIMLTPFQVTTARDQGYFAANTLAGSRLNSNLADLASSITVVTKQQMDDTASVDINDVFRYEANTEGSSTYTPLVLDRGTLKDTIGGYSFGNTGSIQTNATSNRVRGLGQADTSVNFFPTNPRVPFDAYNTQSVEISRGPNSMLFGLGSPAGIVNQTQAAAILNRNSASVQLRYGSFDSYRGSFNLNRSIIDDTLALYVAGLYENRGFQRKPSHDKTDRQYVAVTYRPFRQTILRASFENYFNDSRRPNFLTPRDFVTPWFQAGRPAYNPVTRSVTILDTGVTYGPYTMSANSPGHVAGVPTNDGSLNNPASPFYVQGINWNDYNRPVLRLDDGNVIDLFQKSSNQYRPAWTNPIAPLYPSNAQLDANGAAWRAIVERRWTQSTGLPAPTNLGSYQYPGISDKSIYDWTKINATSANFGELRAKSTMIELEQQITDRLFFNAGFFRQDLDSKENYTISQTTGATVFVDTNTHLPDGSVNAYFGLPYIEDFQADTFTNPEVNDNYRAQLAYLIDFTDRDDKFRWLGRHNMVGLWSKQEATRSATRSRIKYVGGDGQAAFRYLPNFALPGTAYALNSMDVRRNYYLASPGGQQGVITQSAGFYGNPGSGGPTNHSVRIYDFETEQFRNYNVEFGTPFFHAGSGRFYRSIETENLGIQSFFLNERIVTTLGWRTDKYRARNTNTGGLSNADMYPTNGLADEELIMNRWGPTEELTGTTRTRGVVVRPFKGFARFDNPDTFLGDLLGDMGFSYNESDNFNPPPSRQTDVFGNELGKPVGTGKDWGVQVSLLDNKLVARMNWYEATNENERTGSAGTLITRLIRMDQTNMTQWATQVVRIRSGLDPDDPTFNSQPLTTAQEQQVAAMTGLPYDFPAGLNTGATQTSISKGYEFQLTYNPTRNWTMKFTGSRQLAYYNEVAPQYDDWLAVRMPVWLAATALDMPALTTFAGGRPMALQNFWSGYGYHTDVTADNNNGWVNTEAFFNLVVDSQVALAKALEGLPSPNLRKYRANFLTNYTFNEGRLRGWSVGGSQRWESKASIGFLGRVADPTRPTVLTASDASRPVYDSGNTYTDLWVSYTTRILNDRVRMKVQLNATNVFENGGLKPIAVNWDGSPYGFRIIDPRTFQLTTTFEF